MVFQPPGSDYGLDFDTKGQEARNVKSSMRRTTAHSVTDAKDLERHTRGYERLNLRSCVAAASNPRAGRLGH
jgi:hypothetical protein